VDLFRRWMFASNGRAVTAVFLGAIGIVGLGVIALTEIRRDAQPGRATAIAGIVLGVAAFTLALVLASR
jgi:Domain of unknown function (DUF4190)